MELTNKQRSYIISECKKRIKNCIIKEGIMNDADEKFEEIKEMYQGQEDVLIGYLWNFLDGEKPNFISYMETSGNLPYNDEEDY